MKQMKIKKENILKVLLVMILLIFIVYVVAFFMNKRDSEALITYNANVTVYERRSGKEVVARIDNTTEDIYKNLSVYSNIFDVGDNLKVQYYKNGNNYYISSVDFGAITDGEKKELTNKIAADPTMIVYQTMIKREKAIEENELSTIIALPDIMKEQKYITLEPDKFFKFSFNNYNDNIIIKETETTKLILEESFNVISFKNYNNENIDNIKYTYEDNYDKDKIIFNGLGKGIYELKVQFKSGDVISYIFI